MTDEDFGRLRSADGAEPFPVGRWAMLSGLDLSTYAINDYDEIAPVFDAVMGLDFHETTHSLRASAIASLGLARPLHCLDLCCGTGLFFHHLSKSFEVRGLGIDRSLGQLAVAKSRPMRRTANVRYEAGDVRLAIPPQGFDVVTINFDALNHLGSSADWRNLFVTARRSLNDNGIFLFDVNLPDRLVDDWDRPEVIVKDNLTYVQLAFPYAEIDGGVRRRTPMIIFSASTDGRFTKLHAVIEQFALPLETIFGMLRECGFSKVSLLQDGGRQPVGHIFNKNRAFIRAAK